MIEEIEENSHVDIKSELGYEGGQNSGNQSFEEDTEEDKPKYEQGGNIVDIDFDSYQPKVKIMVTSHSKKIQRKTNLSMNKVVISLISTSTVCQQIHGFNKHTEIIEEDTNKDKPNYQFGGHNSVDFEEDTLPKVSGQNEVSKRLKKIQRRQHHRHQKYQWSRKHQHHRLRKYQVSRKHQHHRHQKCRVSQKHQHRQHQRYQPTW